MLRFLQMKNKAKKDEGNYVGEALNEYLVVQRTYKSDTILQMRTDLNLTQLIILYFEKYQY